MPRTTTRGYVTPELTLEGSNVPDDMEALAQSINADVDTVDDAVTTETAARAAADTAAATDYEYAYSTWKPYARWAAYGVRTLISGSAQVLRSDGELAPALTASERPGLCAVRLDPADLDAGARDTELRVRATVIAQGGAAPPAISVQLFVATAYSAGTNNDPYISAQSAVGDDATTATSLGASTAESDPYNHPVAGVYVMRLAPDTQAASSSLDILVDLLYRQVP